jgi:DNA polymerase elongation subunit (family B)
MKNTSLQALKEWIEIILKIITIMNLICFDIETFPDFFSIAAKDINTGQKYWYCKTGSDTIIEGVTEFFKQFEPFFLIGYNSVGFDEPVLSFAVQKTVKEVCDFANICATKREKRSQIEHIKYINYAYKKKFISRFQNSQSIDLILHFNRIDRVSLKKLGITLNLPNLIELPYPPNTEVLNKTENAEEEIKFYNFNDVEVTEAVYREMYEEVKLRYDVGNFYNMDLANTSRSVMGLKIFRKIYLDKYPEMKPYIDDGRTHYKEIFFSNIVSEKVRFESKELCEFLNEVKSQKFYAKNNTYLNCKTEVKFERVIRIGNMNHTFMVGGIHSNNTPAIFEADDNYDIVDADVTSFYPAIMLQEKAYPKHLGEGFLELFEIMVNQRIVAKKTGNKIQAEALKIVINSIYGKMGSPNELFYDPQSLYKVTINGQLYLLMLAERLNKVSIDVFYSNTDGITAKIHKSKLSEYHRICKEWETELGLSLEYVKIKKFMLRDVNNYAIMNTDGSLKFKGDFLQKPKLGKQLDALIVSKAVFEHIFNNKSFKEVIKNSKNPLDFLMSQKIGDDFYAELQSLKKICDVIEVKRLPNINRYYASNSVSKSGYLFKIRKTTNQKEHVLKDSRVVICNDMSKFDFKDVNYNYYEDRVKSVLGLFSKQNQLNLFNL